MRSVSFRVAGLIAVSTFGLGSSCGKIHLSIYSNPTNGTTLPVLTGANVLSITVDGSTCSLLYPDKPCASVTICDTSGANCQTINDILVDTGSFGLRIFKSLITSFTPVLQTQGANTVNECVEFGDGSTMWGPVSTVGVVLGTEGFVNVPIQLIDSSTAGSNCGSSPDTAPSDTGLNGILGVGLLAADDGYYMACVGSSCTETSVITSKQVTNPVSLLPVDNNGVILELPNLGLGGTPSMSGYLVLGLGTETNNVLSNVNVFTADVASDTDTNFLDMSTSFQGISNPSFLDSGSNALYFPDSDIGDCSVFDSELTGFFCPLLPLGYSANNTSNSGSPTTISTFQIGNAYTLFNSGNAVFVEIGGDSGGGLLTGFFDWGLPFFIGRNIGVGINGMTSSLGTGPYWAY